MTLSSPLRAEPFVDRFGKLSSKSFEFLQDIINALNGVDDANGFVVITLGGVKFTVGIGDPNTVVVGRPPDLYFSLSGGAGATLWVKESGVDTNTGWIGK